MNISRLYRLMRVSKRGRPEHIKQALKDAEWLIAQYPPYELRKYLEALDGKINKMKSQRKIELENELNELKK